MKKTRSYLIILYVFLLAACSGEKTYRIGFSQCAEGRWREKVNEEMLAAQHLFEHDAKVFIASATGLSAEEVNSL